MTKPDYTKNGQAWQDTLKAGDPVFVQRWTQQLDGLFSMSGERTEVASIGVETITTLDGEVFSKATRLAMDFVAPGQKIELTPVEDDDVQMKLPSVAEVMAGGYSRDEALEIINLLREDDSEDQKDNN